MLCQNNMLLNNLIGCHNAQLLNRMLGSYNITIYYMCVKNDAIYSLTYQGHETSH